MKKNISRPYINNEKVDKVLQEAVKMGNELKSFLLKARDKFENADEKTKKKVVMGVFGAAAALAAIVGAKKIAKRGRK